MVELLADAQEAAPSTDPPAEAVCGFGPLGIAAIIVILVDNGLFVRLRAILVLLWTEVVGDSVARDRIHRAKELGRTVAVGIVFGIGVHSL